MICVPIVARSAEEALRYLEKAEEIADVIELRLDLLPEGAWLSLLKKEGKPKIITLRPGRQGGQCTKPEEERIRILEEMMVFHPHFIDVEWDTPPHLINRLKRKMGGETRLISSCHDFEKTPEDLEGIWKKVNSLGGDLIKIATMAQTVSDNVKLLRLAQNHPDRTIAFAMGPIGIPSRILTLSFGGMMTYGSLHAGTESAPGQVPVSDLRCLYRVKEITRRTAIYGLLGNPVSHALSPTLHNAAFREIGYDAVYLPLQVPDLDRILPTLRFMGVHGCSVTIPHKEGIIPVLDEADEKARSMGAVNTIHRNGEEWWGTNTDYLGAWKALEESGYDLGNRRWVILGTGGAARAVAYSAGLFGNPKSLSFVGRSPDKLDQILKDVKTLFPFPVRGVTFAETESGKRLDEADIIVNCTPVGMAPRADRIPISSSLLSPDQLVFDTVYNPLETELLKEAKRRRCKTVSGLRMLLHQGALQFELWTGKKAPLSRMEEKALERLGK